jgi:hypothetical protein
MPLLAGMLANMAAAFATWLLKYFTQKVAFTVASIAIVTALSAALFVALRVAMNGAVYVANDFHPMFGVGVSMVISPRVAALLTGYVAFYSLVELYKWKMKMTLFWGSKLW